MCQVLGAAKSRGLLTMGSQLEAAISGYEGSVRSVQVGAAMVDEAMVAAVSRVGREVDR